ncbi:hypothetical protein KFK09_004383 [Dendrobium nobile]|uniref:Uncharacterized protein n=1 Tax=Dendrobium nobile TaxID=94219 RepID=A0A8T3C2M9_DENNO|nr:hypothetical protein KFK09_004383 [Dendrobium nobile]
MNSSDDMGQETAIMDRVEMAMKKLSSTMASGRSLMSSRRTLDYKNIWSFCGKLVFVHQDSERGFRAKKKYIGVKISILNK